MERWGDGEMGRWGDGEMGRWGDGEMGRWGDGEMGNKKIDRKQKKKKIHRCHHRRHKES